MSRQAAIERAAGITPEIARVMTARNTPDAQAAMDLLWIQTRGV